jgi:hypothetical protein
VEFGIKDPGSRSRGWAFGVEGVGIGSREAKVEGRGLLVVYG